MREFSRSKDGYNIEEVNKFVDEMVDAYSNVLDKLKKKDEEIESLNKKLNESDKIIENAKDNASLIVNEALLEAKKIEEENTKLKEETKKLKTKVKSMLEDELKKIEDNDE